MRRVRDWLVKKEEVYTKTTNCVLNCVIQFAFGNCKIQADYFMVYLLKQQSKNNIVLIVLFKALINLIKQFLIKSAETIILEFNSNWFELYT